MGLVSLSVLAFAGLGLWSLGVDCMRQSFSEFVEKTFTVLKCYAVRPAAESARYGLRRLPWGPCTVRRTKVKCLLALQYS